MTKPTLLSLLPAVAVFADHHPGTTIERPAGLPAKSDPAQLTKAGFEALFNEKDLTDTDEKHTSLKGFIAFQVHGGPSGDILWKNVSLKEL